MRSAWRPYLTLAIGGSAWDPEPVTMMRKRTRTALHTLASKTAMAKSQAHSHGEFGETGA